MKRVGSYFTLLTIILSAGIAQAQTSDASTGQPKMLRPSAVELSGPSSQSKRRAGFSLVPIVSFTIIGATQPVVGGGTLGRVTKWTGFSSNSVIGDTTIFEISMAKSALARPLRHLC